MNLRRQLLLVSLLTLILPWAGCQFVRETESALRTGQEQMLSATAKAVADSLSQFHYELLSNTNDSDTPEDRLYAHPLARPPLVDGYSDDWEIPEGSMATLRGTEGASRYVVGSSGQYLYLFVDARDANVVYLEPSVPDSDRRFADHITVLSVDSAGDETEIDFAAEAPGEIIASRRAANQVFQETRVQGYWQDTPHGYRLEARIPKSLVDSRLGLTVTNTGDPMREGVASSNYSSPLPGPLVSISRVLQIAAEAYVQDGLRLIVTDKDGWRLAQTGSVSTTPNNQSKRPSGWLRMIYRYLLEPGAEADLAEPAPGGREYQSYIGEALQGLGGVTSWFRSADTGRAVISAAEPIWSGTVQTGAVVLQKGTDEIFSLANRVLTRLIILTLISTLVVALVLLGYASWLSLRIQRLSNAAEHALDERTLHSALPSALAGDEVGDLSRSFSSVLRQLGTYNEYLQSLAGKLSHELRTPLTIVRSSLENLEHEDLSKEALDYTARAREGTDRLQKILRAMSEASRTEALVENVEPEPLDLHSILESTVSAYADAWPERKFEYACTLDAALVVGSPELLIQMLDKLVDNAVDFTSAGDTIELSLRREAHEYVVAVANPGPALPEEMRSRLFNSMVSVRSGEPGKHLGLGLYIARLIAEGHGGTISAQNIDGGVSFQVRLPVNHS